MTKYLDVIRLDYGEDGILGVLRFDGRLLSQVYTLELPYRKNVKNYSSIPVGQYSANLHESPNHGPTVAINNVPNRSHILIHVGNTIKDLRGCIAVGDRIGNINGFKAVLNSKETLEWLLEFLKEQGEFSLRVL